MGGELYERLVAAVGAAECEWHEGSLLEVFDAQQAAAMLLLLHCAPSGAALRVSLKRPADDAEIVGGDYQKRAGVWLGPAGPITPEQLVAWMGREDAPELLPYERWVTVFEIGGGR